MRYVVIVGTTFGAKSIHGPFDTVGEAAIWCSCYASGQPIDIEPLRKPEAMSSTVPATNEDLAA